MVGGAWDSVGKEGKPIFVDGSRLKGLGGFAPPLTGQAKAGLTGFDKQGK